MCLFLPFQVLNAPEFFHFMDMHSNLGRVGEVYTQEKLDELKFPFLCDLPVSSLIVHLCTPSKFAYCSISKGKA